MKVVNSDSIASMLKLTVLRSQLWWKLSSATVYSLHKLPAERLIQSCWQKTQKFTGGECRCMDNWVLVSVLILLNLASAYRNQKSNCQLKLHLIYLRMLK